ncbi:MAG TPA: LuxR C-terminal-related transcriptional regulator [Nocardioides sp.]
MKTHRPVQVLSRHTLLSQTVRAGLLARGLAAETLPFGHDHEALRHALTADDVVVLLEDLATEDAVRRVAALVAGVPACWLVLTDRPEGAAWGALLEAGALAVLPAAARLEELEASVRAVLLGQPLGDPEQRRRLVAEWVQERQQQEELGRRLATLTCYQRLTLDLLEEGHCIAAIAERSGATETTVRTRLRAVLSKLDVHSQVGAVAAVRRARTAGV